MWPRRFNKVVVLAAVGGALALGWWSGRAWSAPAPRAGAAAPSAGPAGYPRASAEVIRAETGKILSDPRFRPRKSIWQRLSEWLEGWQLPQLRLPKGWGDFLAWVVLVWGALTLAAILGHLVWTVVTLVRGRSGRGAGSRLRRPHFRPDRPTSYEELCRRMSELARAGQLRAAVGVMMLALLRWLEGAGLVRLHASKTNGDYLREFPLSGRGRDEFHRFVSDFDGVIYGGPSCTPQAYRQLNLLFQQVRLGAGRQGAADHQEHGHAGRP
jgi:hypothetical protein